MLGAQIVGYDGVDKRIDVLASAVRFGKTVYVRLPEEAKEGYIEGSVNIPLDEIRSRIDELPRDRGIIVYCKVGLRA